MKKNTHKNVLTLIALLVLILGISVVITLVTMHFKESALVAKFGEKKADEIERCLEVGFSKDYCLEKIVGRTWEDESRKVVQ